MRQARILQGDVLDRLPELEAESFDGCLCDPPYAFPGGFMGKAWDRFGGREDVAFGYYLAGLVDGEGCFRVQRHERGSHTCTFSVHLRRDDRAVLEKAARFAGAGSVLNCDGEGQRRPMARWTVQDKEGCAVLVGLFRRFPLHAKKGLDFETWAEAVEEWLGRPRGNRWHGGADQARAAALKARIERCRTYVDPPWSGHRFQDWCRQWAEAVFRVLTPGAFLLAFGGTRSYHRLACAIEDAGFEIRDSILVPGVAWVHGQGFPKSLDISGAVDARLGADRQRNVTPQPRSKLHGDRPWMNDPDHRFKSREAITSQAAEWAGYGTALKPAWEPVVVAMRPLAGTFAENALRHGVAGLNIEGCRIGTSKSVPSSPSAAKGPAGLLPGLGASREGTSGFDPNLGRWPANLILVHHPECILQGEEVHEARLGFEPATRSPTLATRRLEAGCHPDCPVAELDRQGGHVGGGNGTPVVKDGFSCGLVFGDGPGAITQTYADTGFASRFFYVAKVSPAERAGSKHPTLKPVDLCAYLAKLILPPPRPEDHRRLLVPFSGAGSEIIGALRAGWEEVVGIEKEPESIEDAQRRVYGDAPLLTRVEVHPEGESAAGGEE